MATTIQEVVDGLAGEVQRAKEQKDRVGYFASLYRQVTVAIQRDVAARAFDDNERMDHYDACFANRYFAALGGWRNSADGVPATWRDALTATQRPDLAIVQHLVLGVNAHINVDLAIATAEAATGQDINSLKNDFDRINDILVGVLRRIQNVLNGISPAMALIDTIGGRFDDKILGFSIKRARGAAWHAAVVLSAQPDPPGPAPVEALLDSTAQGLGQAVLTAGQLVRPVLAHETPTLEVDEVIDRLDHATG